MIRTGPSEELIRHINILLNKKENQVEDEVKDEVKDEVEDNTTDEGETDEETDDEEYSREQVEKYIPKKISFLTIADDEYNQKIVKRDNPIIYEMGLCPCGGKVSASNKARHLRSYRHQRYMAQQS